MSDCKRALLSCTTVDEFFNAFPVTAPKSVEFGDALRAIKSASKLVVGSHIAGEDLVVGFSGVLRNGCEVTFSQAAKSSEVEAFYDAAYTAYIYLRRWCVGEVEGHSCTHSSTRDCELSQKYADVVSKGHSYSQLEAGILSPVSKFNWLEDLESLFSVKYALKVMSANGVQMSMPKLRGARPAAQRAQEDVDMFIKSCTSMQSRLSESLRHKGGLSDNDFARVEKAALSLMAVIDKVKLKVRPSIAQSIGPGEAAPVKQDSVFDFYSDIVSGMPKERILYVIGEPDIPLMNMAKSEGLELRKMTKANLNDKVLLSDIAVVLLLGHGYYQQDLRYVLTGSCRSLYKEDNINKVSHNGSITDTFKRWIRSSI